MAKKVKILTLDIETAPHVAYVWGAWKNNVGLNQLKENGYIMSFAAKWLGSDQVIYEENRSDNDRALVKKMLKLLDEADIVVAHNGKKFDLPWIIGRAVKYNLPAPSPYKIVDTLLVARKEFRLFSNKLEYLAKHLGVAPKMAHGNFPGFELWLECLKKNDDAWAEMRAYNIQDVLTLEEVYLRMRPYMRFHPNVGVFQENEKPVCPRCGGSHIHYRGYYRTNVGKYKRFRCNDCGSWGRTRATEYPKDVRKVLTVSAV